MSNVLDRLHLARTHLLLDHAEFGSLALNLDFSDKNPTNAPMATDGTYIYYTPSLIADWTDGELQFTIAHEALHCGFLHPYRMGTRLLHEWNEAADYAINLLLVESGVGQPPAGVLYDTQYKNLSAEQIYSKRHAQASQASSASPRPSTSQTSRDDQDSDTSHNHSDNQQRDASYSDGDSQDPCASQNNSVAQSSSASTRPGAGANDVVPAPNAASQTEGDTYDGHTSQRENDTRAVDTNQTDQDAPTARMPMSELDWQIATEQAFLVGKKAGADTANLSRAIAEQTAPQSDLYEKLRSFVEALVPSDYSWRAPNKRYLVDANLFLPGVVKESTPPIVVAIDTSSSVTQPMLNIFGALLTEVVREFKPREVHVIYADSSVKHTQVFTPDDAAAPGGLKLEAKGGGGTAFGPTFRHIADDTDGKYNEVAAIVYVTDLEGSDNSTIEPPTQPVLWVTPLHETTPEPWGTRAYVDIGRSY